MTLPILTERLVLRRFTMDDVPDILAFMSHSSVARIVREIEATEAGVRKYIQMQNSCEPFEQDKWFSLAVARKEIGRVMGLVSLVCKDHRQGQCGWAFGTDYRGQGYATEAARGLLAFGFDTLGLHRISADTTSTNPASWRLMERLGMRREAHLREAEFRDGEWIDYFIYGILADEWQNMEKSRGPMVVLLVIDMQVGLFEGQLLRYDAEGVIQRINMLARAVRTAGGTVIFIQHDESSGALKPGTDGW